MDKPELFQQAPMRTPIIRADGVNDSERYLKRLCERSFLSLWSYVGVYRDRGRSGTQREGKEVADLLVVFGNHVLIFQDKDCKVPDSGDLQADWSRWYKKTVKAAADQISGAERHIRSSNGDLYIDHACSQPLPISFPDMQKAVFHRIIVAHGASDRCKKEFGGGSGSLMIWPEIIDSQHFESQNLPVMPFAIGQVDSRQGYIHVLDDATLDIVLGTLDTITDFTDYLTRKEAFINSGKLTSATGEEDLLALYFKNVNEQGHDFILPPGITHLAVFEGMWQQFCDSPERRAQIAADEVSFCWDNLIEAFNRHIIQGTQYISNTPDYQRDVAVRYLAREPRTRRRMLARHLLGLIRRTGASERGAGVMAPSRPGDPYFVFLLLPRYASMPYEDYRRARFAHLQDYLMVVRLHYPDANDIVGIATESGLEEFRSEDLAYFDARDWTTEDEEEAKRVQDEFNVLKDIKPRRSVELEYPVDSVSDRRHDATVEQAPGKRPSTGKVGRNEQGPCGSGVKYKRCHGR